MTRTLLSGSIRAGGRRWTSAALQVAACVALCGGMLATAVGTAGASPAPRTSKTLYAYPAGGATSPTSCPETSTASQQCDLTEALALTAAGDTVLLVDAGTHDADVYVGNFDLETTGTTTAKPVTIEPVPGAGGGAGPQAILSGNGGAAGGCTTASCSGPILTIGEKVHVDIARLSFEDADNATTDDGGAISSDGDVAVSDSTFAFDQANDDGGAIDSGGDPGTATLTVSDSTFTENDANDGGAIDSGDRHGIDTVVISGSTFDGNSGDDGGAIDSGDSGGQGTLTISSSTFEGNSGEGGGAINSDCFDGSGRLQVSSSSFISNHAEYPGGALLVGYDGAGTGAVADSTFVGNTSGSDGGGAIEFGAKGTFAVADSTFAGNLASIGGALANEGKGTLDVGSSTFDDNLAEPGDGGSVLNSSLGTLALGADIIAGSGGNACAGKVTDDGYDISDDKTCALSHTGSVKGSSAIDDYLGTIGGYGGPTETIPLLAKASVAKAPRDPALGAIPKTFKAPGTTHDVCSTKDQRGVARTAPCDVGAFELAP